MEAGNHLRARWMSNNSKFLVLLSLVYFPSTDGIVFLSVLFLLV